MVYEYTKPRQPVAASMTGPGPSAYGLPTLVGQENHDPRSVHYRSPAYKLGIPGTNHSGPYSPGPVYLPKEKVLRVGFEGGRSYTMYPKLDEPKRFSVPAPGTYENKPVDLVKSRSPAYSFGLVCPPIKTDQTPGPNRYNPLPEKFGRSYESSRRQYPAYSIYSRSKTGGFDEDFAKTPAPGTYGDVNVSTYKKKLPQYSLTGRNMMPGDSTQKPGPGAHYPELVGVTKKSTPRFSFGIRHSQYEAPLIVKGID